MPTLACRLLLAGSAAGELVLRSAGARQRPPPPPSSDVAAASREAAFVAPPDAVRPEAISAAWDAWKTATDELVARGPGRPVPHGALGDLVAARRGPRGRRRPAATTAADAEETQRRIAGLWRAHAGEAPPGPIAASLWGDLGSAISGDFELGLEWSGHPSLEPSIDLAGDGRFLEDGAAADQFRRDVEGRVWEKAATDIAQPVPYAYDTFLPWFEEQPWEKMRVGLSPQRFWVDVDGAVGGKFKEHFEAQNMDRVVAVAKAIDRFEFMRSIMVSGDGTSQASLAMHLLILSFLQEELTRPGGVTALDIGCGTGWLLKAFAMMSDDPGSRILGLDLHGAETAASLAADPATSAWAPRTPSPEVFVADAMEEDFGLDEEDRRRLLPEESFDIVNVGMAVCGMDDAIFLRAFDLLRIGGVLTVPVCDCTAQHGRCDATFKKFEKDETGYPVLRESAGGITFVTPT